MDIARENTAQLDADLSVVVDVEGQHRTVLADPLYQALSAVRPGSVARVTDESVMAAYSFNSALSLPYAVDALVPLSAEPFGKSAAASPDAG